VASRVKEKQEFHARAGTRVTTWRKRWHTIGALDSPQINRNNTTSPYQPSVPFRACEDRPEMISKDRTSYYEIEAAGDSVSIPAKVPWLNLRESDSG